MSNGDTRPLAIRLLAASRFAVTKEDALAHIRARRAALLSGPPAAPAHEPDFTAAEPTPVLDQPEKFAAEFWRARKLPGPDDQPPKPKPTKLRGRRPRGELTPDHERFRVVDGDKQG
jgi:hypothetical protein